VNRFKWYFYQAISDAIAQSWAVFGLLVGWIVLPDGETRNFIGILLIAITLVWAVTMPLRIESFDKE